MITPYSHSKFVEKILTNAKGEQFRVVFCVSLIGGEIKAHIVSATPISQGLEQKKVLCLPVVLEKVAQEFTYTPAFAPVLSPFNQFFFFNSQPTRAPSNF